MTELEAASDGVSVDGEPFDFAVECTWGALDPPRDWDLYYEPCIMLLYEGERDHPALTIMDGPFFSLFPYRESLFSLTSVEDTPLGRCHDADQARSVIAGVGKELVNRKRAAMERLVEDFYPPFRERFQFRGFEAAVKTKIADASDARCAMVQREERVFHVFAGKIDAIFEAADEVRSCLARFS